MKYRKKPLHIEAIQLAGATKIRDWNACQDANADGWWEGKKGDWLLTFPDGHQEIWKDRAFLETFEPEPVFSLPHGHLPGARGGQAYYPPQTIGAYPTNPVGGAPIVYCQAAP